MLEKKEKKLVLLVISIAVIMCLLAACGNYTNDNIKNVPNGTLEDLNEKYLLSYMHNGTIEVNDYSNNFKKTLKGTKASIGEAVKILAEEKAKTLIMSKNDIQFIDTRIIDADGEGRYIVAMLRKDNKGFADAYLALVELDENTGMYRAEAHYHGEFFIGDDNVSGSYSLDMLYKEYIGKNWGTELNIEVK